ncbi:MAG: hypothetical protein HEP71_13085 [Roseivirga sp.]|nr:hypothetical protein [Roseivirga sp.]
MAQTLTGYDMVLALSETTINKQFAKLHQENVIYKEWKLLAGHVFKQSAKRKPFFITGGDKNFSSRLNIWMGLQQDFVKTGDFSLLSSLTENHNNFDFGWNTVMKAPVIQIEDRNTQEVVLNLAFQSGHLYYLSDPTSKVSVYDLKGCVYSFRVPIGKLKINKQAMMLQAQDEMNSVIRESGLKDADFTIESLFLNFRNARINQFDSGRSKFPQHMAVPLTAAISNYFNLFLPDSENPYVLGYGVSRAKIGSREKAMFQPTSVGFSTSYSSRQGTRQQPGQFSVLNFLMMVNNAKAPTSQTAGVLARSLLESGKAQKPPASGIFAIEHKLFTTYLSSLDKYVETIFSSQKGVNINGGFKSGVMRATQRDYHKKHDTIDTTYTLTREPIKNLAGAGGIEVRYKLQVRVRVGIHIGKNWEIKSATLSTSGPYTKGDIKKKGSVGYLTFQLKGGKQGRFDLTNKLTKPNIAFDENPNMFEGPVGKVIGSIVTLIFAWPMAIVNGIIGQIVADLGVNTAVKDNPLIDSLNQLDLLNKTNKVILPLGKTYTYKNLRYLADKKLVVYDIAY